MTNLELRQSFNSTSADSAMLRLQTKGPILVGFMLAGLGTSTAYAAPPDMVSRSHRFGEHTTAGTLIPSVQPGGKAIGELRRLSGLTWNQLARLFSVSRRSLHFWASGKAMTPSNEEHLQRVLAVLLKVDRGIASANRTALLTVGEGGAIPFDLLVKGDYERALSILGSSAQRRVAAPKAALEARVARVPAPPENLVDALQDRVHPASGRLLAAKPIATRRRK